MTPILAERGVGATNTTIVYVIDDDESMRFSLSTLLRSIGLRVETFASPQAFLGFKKSNTPSCLILDVRLRGENGLTFQQEMISRGLHMPILFMTGYGDMAMCVKAMKAGALDFFSSCRQFINYSQQGGGRVWTFRRNDTESSVSLNGRLSVSALEAVREAVLAGMGLAVAPEWMFLPELKSGQVRTVLTDWRLPPCELWAVIPAGRMASRKTRAFITFVQETLGQPNASLVAPRPCGSYFSAPVQEALTS
jgi:CheY-like chemotaxis protein